MVLVAPPLAAVALLQWISLVGSARAVPAGFHIDIETCSGNIGAAHNGQTGAQQQAACASFFGRLDNISRAAMSISSTLPHRLRFAVDTGMGWACGAEPGSGCINITWNGTSKPVAHHVIDVADEAALMDYTRDPANVYARALPHLAYADTLEDGAGRIRVGVAVGCVLGQEVHGKLCAEDAPRGSRPTLQGWATRNETELAKLLAAAEPLLRKHRSFAGFAVYHNVFWYEQYRANPAPSETQWPRGTAAWYSNHTVLLDPDLRREWLDWAKSRSISEIYIAPHATNIPLLGGGWGGARETAFCDFLRQAATQGLGVMISGDCATKPSDIEFIQKCSAEPVSV
jgi:hypothetical protein